MSRGQVIFEDFLYNRKVIPTFLLYKNSDVYKSHTDFPIILNPDVQRESL